MFDGMVLFADGTLHGLDHFMIFLHVIFGIVVAHIVVDHFMIFIHVIFGIVVTHIVVAHIMVDHFMIFIHVINIIFGIVGREGAMLTLKISIGVFFHCVLHSSSRFFVVHSLITV